MLQSGLMGNDKHAEATLDYLIAMRKEVQEIIKANKTFGFSDKSRIFYKKQYLSGAQMYGPRIERYILQKIGLDSVRISEDRGDGRNSHGDCFEIKVSYRSNLGGSFNFLQFRLWQNLKGYCLIAVDTANNFQDYIFYLNTEEVAFEIGKLGGLCHLSQESSKFNVNKEHRLTLQKSYDWSRWLRNYHVKNITELKKIMKASN